MYEVIGKHKQLNHDSVKLEYPHAREKQLYLPYDYQMEAVNLKG